MEYYPQLIIDALKTVIHPAKGKDIVSLEMVEDAIRIIPAMRSPTILPLAAKGWCSLDSVVDEDSLWEKVRQLKAIGAEGILVLNVDKIIA